MKMKSIAALFGAVFLGSCSGGVSSGPPSAAPVMPAEGGGGQPATATTPPPRTPPKLRLPDTVAPTEYRVDLTIDPDADTFRGRVEIAVEVRQPIDHLWLHAAANMTVKEASLERDGQSWPLTLVEEDSEHLAGFELGQVIEPGPATLELAFDGVIDDKGFEGVFKQKDDETWYVYTQFEALGARKAFPSFDEPGFKVPWQLTLRVKEGDQALSNTPVVDEKTEGGLRVVTFAKTKPMPSYLVAFAVGPFEVVDAGTAGRNKTPVRIIVPRGHTAKAAHAVSTVGPLQERLEDYFDMAYPYEKLDHIALPVFFGAMENPGLITYASSILLTKPEDMTAQFERGHAGIVAHEVAHQWFGNLVTMKWWDDIWLNESFATWAAAKVVSQWKPEWQGEVYLVSQRDTAMEADSLITARKIRQPIETEHDIARAFDAISYQKGGAVLTMFERWTGEEAFRAGVRAYMKKHAWGNADAADFLAAIGAATDPQMKAAFETFLNQAGVPLLEVQLSCDKGQPPTLALQQSRFLPSGSAGSNEQVWQMPVCVKYGDKKTSHTTCELVTTREATIELAKAKSCPTWVLPNAEGAGYYRTVYPEGMLGKLFGDGRRQLTVADRLGIVGDTSALVESGRASIAEALAMVPTLLQDQSDHVVGNAVTIVKSVDGHVLRDELRPNYIRLVQKLFTKRARALGWSAKPKEGDTVRMLRPNLLGLVARDAGDKVLTKEARRLAEVWLDKRTGVDPDLVGTVLQTAAYHGDRALYDRMREAALTTKDRTEQTQLIGALGSFRSKDLIEENFKLFLEKGTEMDLRASFGLVMGPLAHAETRPIVYGFIKDNFETLSERLPPMARGYIVLSAAAFCDQAHYDDAKAFFGPKVEKIPGAPKLLDQALERIELCMAFKAQQQPKLDAYLKKH